MTCVMTLPDLGHASRPAEWVTGEWLRDSLLAFQAQFRTVASGNTG